MSTIIKLSKEDVSDELIQFLAKNYFSHYRGKGVCLILAEVIYFLKRVTEHDLGYLLVSFDGPARRVQGFLVAFPLVDYHKITGMYNLSGNDILYSQNVLFLDSLIDIPGFEGVATYSLLSSLPYKLDPRVCIKKILATATEQEIKDNQGILKILQKDAYREKGAMQRSEVKFTPIGVRRITTKNHLFFKDL